MTTRTSTLRIDLVDDVTKHAQRVAAALERTQKDALALRAALDKSGTTDRLQASLKKMSASAAHIQGVAKAWKDYTKAESIAEKASGWTKEQANSVRSWENITVSAVRGVMREEKIHAQVRKAQEAEAERDRKLFAAQAARDAKREENARIAAMKREAARAHREAERLRHEQARVDNTVAGAAAIYMAHNAFHTAARVGERYREFDKERRYAQVVMGVNDEKMKPLVEQAIRGGATSKFNDIQWLGAQRELSARGYNPDQVRAFTPTAALLGQAFDTNMSDGVKAFEGAMLGFKKDVSTFEKAQAAARRTADLEVKVSKISGMKQEDIVELYKRGAPAARMAGLSEETMLSFGAIAKKANIGGDEAATAFVSLTKNLLSPTREAQTAMRAAGIDYSKYQKMGPVDEGGFADEVARNYGVKLKGGVRAGLHKIFSNPEIMNDPTKFTPAVMRLLKRDLYGNDAKSLKSIAGLAQRYRAASATGVDTNGLVAAIMDAMAKNPAIGNAIFGGKQGGRIYTALGDKELFAHIMDQLQNHSEGFAQKVSDDRMAGFDGALSKLSGSIANLETAVGRAFDNDGKGGLLTNTTLALGTFTNMLVEANPAILRMGGTAVLAAGAFAALKSVDFFRGGFGLNKSAVALDHSAVLLDDAAVALGASKGAQAAAAVAGGAAESAKAGATPKGIMGSSGLKGMAEGLSKGLLTYFAMQAGEAAIDGVLDRLPHPKYPEGYDPNTNKNRGVIGDVQSLWNDVFGSKERLSKDAAPAIAGHRARGGPVSQGLTYLVGEHGPELFTPGLSGAISTADVQRMLARASLSARAEKPDAETASEIRMMSFALVGAIDGIARTLDRERFKGSGDGFGSGSSGGGGRDAGGGGGSGDGGGRRGFMERRGHFGDDHGGGSDSGAGAPGPGGRRGLLERHGHFGGNPNRGGAAGTGGDGGGGVGAGNGTPEQYRSEFAARLKSSGFSNPEIANTMGVMQGESHFKPVDENLKYSAKRIQEVFTSHGRPKFSWAQAQAAAATGPRGVANLVYGGRMGNTHPDDGWKYRGRGLIQITGHDNYARIGKMIGADLENHPDLVNDPKFAAKAAAAYWQMEKKAHANLSTIGGALRAAGAAGGAQRLGERAGYARGFLPKVPQMVADGETLIKGGGIKPGGGGPVAGGGKDDAVPGDVAGRLASFKRMGVLSNQQCVELAKRFVGSGESVHSWRPGDRADAGGLKPGTPVATFLNRGGGASDRYAGGGSGTPGAHLDHAAVFENYVRDGSGKVVGMRVAEQWKGSHGVHDKVYNFNNGRFGEGNGSNYRAIKLPDGSYLGHGHNPMTTPSDDPGGFRHSREVAGRRAQGSPHLASAGPLAPATDNRHLDTTIAKLEHIHRLTHGINAASSRHGSGGPTHIAGLGAKLRGGFMHSGRGMG